MQLDRHYTDPSLVSIYDIENSGRQDIDFYLALARELGARDVVDLGCGTGVLACDLAAAGVRATGVDPALAMLEFARSRPGGRGVRWVHGDSSAMESGSADLVVMTGHVAQVFLTDDDWDTVLRDGLRALRPGGHLAFETRNPDAAAWLRWTREDTYGSYPLPGGGSFESWVEVIDVRWPLVDFEGHNLFSGPAGEPLPGPGADLIVSSTLRFPSRTEVEVSLVRAGFRTVDVHGDWDRGSAGPASAELIFVARR